MAISIVLSGAPPIRMDYGFGGQPSIEVVITSSHQALERRVSFQDVFFTAGILEEFARLSFEFPNPGASTVQSIETGRGDEAVALWARLIAPSLPKMFGFLVPSVPGNDTLVITALPPKSFVGSFLHQKHAVATPCMVFCADGKQSQTCITCEDGDGTVRICC